MRISELFLGPGPNKSLAVTRAGVILNGPEVLSHRIGVDTGAVFGGPLTCAVLQGDRVGFICV